MDKAVIIGASGGIGAALMERVEAREVLGLSRREDGLDLLDEASIARVAEGVAGPIDLIIDATGALEIDGVGPEKSMAQVTGATMAAQFAVNAIGPALLFKHFAPVLARDRRAVFASLSARVGSIGDNRLGGWVSYRAAKAALNQVMHTASIELSRTHPLAVCVAVHPGTVATALTEDYLGRHPAVGPRDAAENVLRVLAGLDVGATGQFLDWQGERIPW